MAYVRKESNLIITVSLGPVIYEYIPQVDSLMGALKSCRQPVKSRKQIQFPGDWIKLQGLGLSCSKLTRFSCIVDYGLSGLIYKYSESSLATQAMLLCLWIWLIAWLPQVILFSLSPPDLSLFLCLWCDTCAWCYSTWTESDKKSDWKRSLELQPMTDWLTVLRAWPVQAASSGPCSAHFITSPKKDTGSYRKAMVEVSSASFSFR